MTNNTEEPTFNVRDLTLEELTEFIKDMSTSSAHSKEVFDYTGHVNELLRRNKSCRLLSRLDIFKAVNDIDRSFDNSPSELYVIDVNELLNRLGL